MKKINLWFIFLTSFSIAAFGQQRDNSEERKALLQLMGNIPERPALNIDTLETAKIDGGVRYKIKYLSEYGDTTFQTPDDWIYAYLFIPDNPYNKKLPAIVAIHQDDVSYHIGKSEPAGLMGDSTMFYGLELFKRGYVVICPDRYYHAERRLLGKNSSFDPSKEDPERDFFLQSYQIGMMLLKGSTNYSKEAYDHSRAVDVLYQINCVDTDRIGTVGHSAGGNAMAYFMFYDERVKAGVSSCGVFDIVNYFSYTNPQPYPGDLAIPGLLKAGYSTFDYVKHISPRSLLLTRGKYEWGKNNKGSVRLVEEVEKFKQEYLKFNDKGNIETIIFEENGGKHSFPYGVRQRVYEWLDTRLKP